MPAAAASSGRVSSSAPFSSVKRHRHGTHTRVSLGAIGGARVGRGIALTAQSHGFRALAASDDAEDASEECPPPDPTKEDTGVQPSANNANDINYRMMALSVAVGLAVRFAWPVPEALTPRAWTLFAIFASTVTGLVAKPAPVGAWAFMALTFTVTTGTLTFQEGLAALTNEVIWLIVVATFFARAFIKTGFGDRLGLLFVKAFGHTTLRLAYGLQTAEAALSPAMPSTTARAAGVFVPVINSLDERTRAYLMGQQLQGGNVTSTLLLSAAAQNFLCMQIAQAQGILFENLFAEWFAAASVPCVVSMLVTPLIIYVVDPPLLKETPEAPIAAAQALNCLLYTSPSPRDS